MARKAAKKGAHSAAKATPSRATAHEPLPAVAGTDRKHTINDIARLANVSKKTVSRVINESPFVREETRTRIADIIKEVGFTPDPQARALAFRRSFLIGLIYDNPNAPYVINIQEGALGALRKMGYELVVHPCDRNERGIPERYSPLRERARSSTASCCCRRCRRTTCSRKCCGSWNVPTCA